MTSRAGVMGMGGRYKDEGGMKGEAGGRVRPATVASRVLCLRRNEAGPATMTSRALEVGMTDGWV